jgi:hypothetical protein
MKNVDTNDVKNAVKHYRDVLGFNVIPLRAGTKSSAIKWKEFQERKPTDEEFENIGIVTGKASRLAVADVDNPKRLEGWLEENGLELRDTATVKTARGFHYYYRIPEGVEVRSKDVGDALELKANGSYVVAPPSTMVKSGRDRKGIDY